MQDNQIITLIGALVAPTIRGEVRAAVRDALDDCLPPVLRAAQRKEHLSRAEAAEFIGRSVRSLDHLRATGRLAYVKRGSRVLFRTVDLEAYLAEAYVPTRHQAQNGTAQ